jgi:hypothetical protein
MYNVEQLKEEMMSKEQWEDPREDGMRKWREN